MSKIRILDHLKCSRCRWAVCIGGHRMALFDADSLQVLQQGGVQMIESLKEMEKDFVLPLQCEGDERVMRKRNVLKYVEDIEREVKERYIKVPLDSDGVPIRLGDMVMNNYEDIPKRVVFLKAHSSGECTVGIVAEGKGAYVSQSYPCCLTHCKALTAKDVIEGALNEAAMLDRKKGYWPSAADITNITDRVVKALGLKEDE